MMTREEFATEEEALFVPPDWDVSRYTVYLAGRMSGKPGFNFPLFFDAEEWLTWQYPWTVINPARHDVIDMGFEWKDTVGSAAELREQGFDKREALRWDCDQILNCDGIVMLGHDWVLSGGAKAEYALAKAIGLDCYILSGNHPFTFQLDSQPYTFKLEI